MEDDNQAAVNETLAEMEQALRQCRHELANEQQRNWALKAMLERLWVVHAGDRLEDPETQTIRSSVARAIWPHWFPAEAILPGMILGGLAIGEYVVL